MVVRLLDACVNAICFLTILFTYQLCIIMGIYGLGREQYQICVSFVVVVGGFFLFGLLSFFADRLCLAPLACPLASIFFLHVPPNVRGPSFYLYGPTVVVAVAVVRLSFLIQRTHSLSRAFTLSWQHTRFDYSYSLHLSVLSMK